MSVERPSAEIADLQDRRDQALVERIARGDEDAFAELFGRYGPAALGLASRVLGDRGLAEEVLQEVFLSIWRRAGIFDSARGSVRSWVLIQIHHKSVDVVRREEAERRRTTTTFPAPGGSRDQEDVIEEQWLAVRRTEVRAALQQLPEEQRRTIELAYYEGLTQTQVARRIDVPLGTVKSRTLTGLRALARALGRGEAG